MVYGDDGTHADPMLQCDRATNGAEIKGDVEIRVGYLFRFNVTAPRMARKWA